MYFLVQASRHLQRRLFIGLIGLCLWSIVQPLLWPQQPPLPVLPAIEQLPGEWRSDMEAVPSQPHVFVHSRRFHPLGSSAALGPTRTLVRPNGDWLRLTPISSWTRSGFSIESATKGIPNLTNQPYQACLTRTGEIGNKNLSDLIGVSDKMVSRPRRLWHILMPVRNRSYSCLLITSNTSDTLDRSSSSGKTLDYLRELISWPDPPALSKPGTRSRVN